MASRSSLRKQLFEQLGRLAKKNIRQFIPERKFGRLRNSIEWRATTRGLSLTSYYYWARWVNDGRGRIEADPGKKLVFFRDPSKDPRLAGGYPRRQDTVRKLKLDKDEFKRLRESGDMIVTDHVGPSEGLQFLEQGIRATRLEAQGKIRELIRGEVRRMIRRSKNSIQVRL